MVSDEAERGVERDGAAAVTATTRAAWRKSLQSISASGGLSPARSSRISAERHHQAEHELRHHAGAGRGQRAERQVAAHREDQRAGGDERAAGDMIAAQDHALTGTLVVRACGHPHTLPIGCTASSTRLASSSQNLANSGWSR